MTQERGPFEHIKMFKSYEEDTLKMNEMELVVVYYNTLQDLKQFKDFVYRSFSKYEQYNDMLPSSNQPVQLHGTAKNHKFDNINDITVDSLKFKPI